MPEEQGKASRGKGLVAAAALRLVRGRVVRAARIVAAKSYAVMQSSLILRSEAAMHVQKSRLSRACACFDWVAARTVLG
jgi:hypothetical protein